VCLYVNLSVTCMPAPYKTAELIEVLFGVKRWGGGLKNIVLDGGLDPYMRKEGKIFPPML